MTQMPESKFLPFPDLVTDTKIQDTTSTRNKIQMGVEVLTPNMMARLTDLKPSSKLNEYQLNCTGFGKTKNNRYILAVGWDNALIVQRKEDLSYAPTWILSHDGTGKPVFGLDPKKPLQPEQTYSLQPPHICALHKLEPCTWTVYKAPDVPIERVVTFGVSSCSFSLMFTPHAKTICLAHIDSKAPIPMGLMANKLDYDERMAKLRLIASVTSDRVEFMKFDKKNAFRHLPSVLGMVLPRCHVITEEDGDATLGGFGHDEIGLSFPNDLSDPCMEGIYGPDKAGGAMYSWLMPMDLVMKLKTIGLPNATPNEDGIKFAKETLNALSIGRYGFAGLHAEIVNNIANKAQTDYKNSTWSTPPLLKHLKSQPLWTIAHIIGDFFGTPNNQHAYFSVFHTAICKYRCTFSLPLRADLHDALRDAGCTW